jgi:hypothetical protein
MRSDANVNAEPVVRNAPEADSSVADVFHVAAHTALTASSRTTTASRPRGDVRRGAEAARRQTRLPKRKSGGWARLTRRAARLSAARRSGGDRLDHGDGEGHAPPDEENQPDQEHLHL